MNSLLHRPDGMVRVGPAPDNVEIKVSLARRPNCRILPSEVRLTKAFGVAQAEVRDS